METDNWVDVNIHKNLIETIDRLVKKTKDEFGRPVYTSRAAFVDEAITEKLKKMEVVAE